MSRSADVHWHTLGLHFAHHVQQVERFRSASKHAVRRMWEHQTNEGGEPLTPFERKALIERHCELFGVWPLDAGHQVCVAQKDRTRAHYNNEPLHASNGAILDTSETLKRLRARNAALVAEAHQLRGQAKQALQSVIEMREKAWTLVNEAMTVLRSDARRRP